jgi:hypothetical protein
MFRQKHREPADARAPSTALYSYASPSSAPVTPSGTTVNFLLDGYYAYDSDNPIGRVNLRVQRRHCAE